MKILHQKQLKKQIEQADKGEDTHPDEINPGQKFDFCNHEEIQYTHPELKLGDQVTGGVDQDEMMMEEVKRGEVTRVRVYYDEQLWVEVKWEQDMTEYITSGWLLCEAMRKLDEVPELSQKSLLTLKTRFSQYEALDLCLTQYDYPLTILKDNDELEAIFKSKLPFTDRDAIKRTNAQSFVQGLPIELHPYGRHTTAQASKSTVTLDDFTIEKVIGKGGFSRVSMVRKNDTGKLYALKSMSKVNITQSKVQQIMNERATMELINGSQFIVKLHWAFQSKNYFHLVMDFCAGGELFFHLIQRRKFSEEHARFYIAEILVGIECLHSKNIIYRDLKPENILIDIDGHIKLADFGLAKLNFGVMSRSYSFCGSPEYMSPEMLGEREHGRAIDYYSLGALLFELLTGLPPFYSQNRNLMYNNILTKSPNIPSNLSSEAQSLLQLLLIKQPHERLGAVGGPAQIKAHAFFSCIDWGHVELKQMQPPLIPDLRKSNFDGEYTSIPKKLSQNEEDEGVSPRQRINSLMLHHFQLRNHSQSQIFKSKTNFQIDLTLPFQNSSNHSNQEGSSISSIKFLVETDSIDYTLGKSIEETPSDTQCLPMSHDTHHEHIRQSIQLNGREQQVYHVNNLFAQFNGDRNGVRQVWVNQGNGFLMQKPDVQLQNQSEVFTITTGRESFQSFAKQSKSPKRDEWVDLGKESELQKKFEKFNMERPFQKESIVNTIKVEEEFKDCGDISMVSQNKLFQNYTNDVPKVNRNVARQLKRQLSYTPTKLPHPGTQNPLVRHHSDKINMSTLEITTLNASLSPNKPNQSQVINKSHFSSQQRLDLPNQPSVEDLNSFSIDQSQSQHLIKINKNEDMQINKEIVLETQKFGSIQPRREIMKMGMVKERASRCFTPTRFKDTIETQESPVNKVILEQMFKDYDTLAVAQEEGIKKVKEETKNEEASPTRLNKKFFDLKRKSPTQKEKLRFSDLNPSSQPISASFGHMRQLSFCPLGLQTITEKEGEVNFNMHDIQLPFKGSGGPRLLNSASLLCLQSSRIMQQEERKQVLMNNSQSQYYLNLIRYEDDLNDVKCERKERAQLDQSITDSMSIAMEIRSSDQTDKGIRTSQVQKNILDDSIIEVLQKLSPKNPVSNDTSKDLSSVNSKNALIIPKQQVYDYQPDQAKNTRSNNSLSLPRQQSYDMTSKNKLKPKGKPEGCRKKSQQQRRLKKSRYMDKPKKRQDMCMLSPDQEVNMDEEMHKKVSESSTVGTNSFIMEEKKEESTILTPHTAVISTAFTRSPQSQNQTLRRIGSPKINSSHILEKKSPTPPILYDPHTPSLVHKKQKRKLTYPSRAKTLMKKDHSHSHSRDHSKPKAQIVPLTKPIGQRCRSQNQKLVSQSLTLSKPMLKQVGRQSLTKKQPHSEKKRDTYESPNIGIISSDKLDKMSRMSKMIKLGSTHKANQTQMDSYQDSPHDQPSQRTRQMIQQMSVKKKSSPLKPKDTITPIKFTPGDDGSELHQLIERTIQKSMNRTTHKPRKGSIRHHNKHSTHSNYSYQKSYRHEELSEPKSSRMSFQNYQKINSRSEKYATHSRQVKAQKVQKKGIVVKPKPRDRLRKSGKRVKTTKSTNGGSKTGSSEEEKRGTVKEQPSLRKTRPGICQFNQRSNSESKFQSHFKSDEANKAKHKHHKVRRNEQRPQAISMKPSDDSRLKIHEAFTSMHEPSRRMEDDIPNYSLRLDPKFRSNHATRTRIGSSEDCALVCKSMQHSWNP